MSKHILLVHDLAGYGKVSLSAMMPVLSHMGHHLYTLPTALVATRWITGNSTFRKRRNTCASR